MALIVTAVLIVFLWPSTPDSKGSRVLPVVGQHRPTSNKVQIDLYVMGQCPGEA